MALTRLNNLISDRTGRMIYVNPDDFNATDLISNNGNSPTKPFKTLQRALLEVSKFSYVAGAGNDRYDQFTICLSPGDYVIDNRPGFATVSGIPVLSDQSNFDILDPDNDLYKFNSVAGGLVIPRGTSIVGMDLRKTRIRPRYVPDPTDNQIPVTSIFKVTGACYFWQFSLFDALPVSDSSGLGGVYKNNSTTIYDPVFSHHKVTCFVYADQPDLDLYYQKVAIGFADIPDTIGELSSTIQENRIVGPLSDIKQISSINITNNVAIVTTSGNHGIFKGQQIAILGTTAPFNGINGTYNVISVDSNNTFRISSSIISTLTPGEIPSGNLTNAAVKAEIDTVDSSSPYIFNCSLRSTYGLCGLWADGAKVTGFKSMVVAQFTGVSLQKDDNAFIKFTETTSPNPDFVLNGGASDATSLHQDSSGYTFYRENWRNYHIRVSNGGFIQSVSVFAVGYAEQHLIESGGDYSITNSNSNFGATSLIADGFRSEAYTLDKKGYFTHIVPPQSLFSGETEVPYYALDVQKSKASASTKLHLFDQTDPAETPVFDVNQYKIGGRSGDKIYVKLVNPSTGLLQEYSATITPNGIETHTISSVDRAQNLFTTATTNNFETGTPVRIFSSNGYLPYGMDPGRLYYAIRISNTTFKIAPTEEDARAGAGGAQNSIVDIRSQIPTGASLTVQAFVGDINPTLPAFNITSVSPSLETFSTGTFTHGFTTGDRIFFRTILENATLPTTINGSLSLVTEYFVIVIDAYTFKIAISESDANANIPINILTPGTSNSLRVYKNVQKSPLRYDPTQNNWYVNVDPGASNEIHPVLTNPSAIYANAQVITTENSYLKRILDDRVNQDRIYRLRYVIPKTVAEARPPLLGYIIKRKTDDNNQIITHELSTNSENVTSTTNDFTRVYYIYKIDTLLKHIPNEQDGIYYLTILLADISPKGIQFGSQTNWFNYLKYSQNSANLYPVLDKDNPVSDPSSAISVADNLVHGFVYQNDEKKSITREAVETFLEETGYSPILTSLEGKAVSGREDRLIPFSGNLPEIQIELRRTSQIRAGNQTFEYTGFSSGNYSAAFPSVQKRILTDKEILYSQAQRRRGGIVFYSGLNAYGDLYVGNQKINAVTGEVEILDKPILKVAASTGVTEVTDQVEYVPYVSGTKNVSIDGSISTQGGPSKVPNTFNNNSIFNEGIKVARQSPSTVNRALVTHDVVYRPKTTPIDSNPLNGNIKQTVLWDLNNTPTPSVEGIYNGDMYYKPFINLNTRNQAWIYTGQSINSGWAQTGLVGTGHLTSIEETYSGSNDPYTVTGKFGINKTNPSAALHVGGSTIIDSDLAVNGGDITTTASTFNLLNFPTTISFGANATSVTIGTNSGILTLRNPTIQAAASTVNLLTNVPNINLGIIGSGGTLTINNDNTRFISSRVALESNKIILNDISIPNTASATGGGIVLKGPVFISGQPAEKKISWAALQNPSNPNELWSTWVSNCFFNLESGLSYNINGIPVLSSTALGSGVINSSLQTVGNITVGTWNATTIALNRGGTGATTQQGAANNILPSQIGNGPINTKFLTTDGTNVSWGIVPTPTIDAVLGSGNTTTKSLTVGTFIANGSITSTTGGLAVNNGSISTTGSITCGAGGISCGGGITANGNISTTGDVIAFASSDIRLKDNVKPIENALNKVLSISGNTYVWNEKSDYSGKKDVGVIAQEVAEVLPEATTTRDNGYMAVRYEKLVPLLIEAIKELKTEVETLKSKLAE